MTLEASSKESLTEDESVAIHTDFAEWAQQLNRPLLNEVDDALQNHPADLARWVYDRWTDRAAVGPEARATARGTTQTVNLVLRGEQAASG